MKTLVIFYSYTGHAGKLAKDHAEKESADIAEIKDAKRPNKLKAYTSGCLKAMRGKSWGIQKPAADMNSYDCLVLFSPIWANNPPPAVNRLIEQFPSGKKVSVNMVSQSGKSGCKEQLETRITSKGCTLEDFKNIRS